MSKRRKKLTIEEIKGIIELCRSIESRGLNPFLVDIDDLIEVLRRYSPNLENPEELCLDAEALNEIASVIKLQSEWVKHRTTSLYTDPFLIEEKIRTLDNDRLAEIFLKTWHPIVELEQISKQGLEEAIEYWRTLPPIDERWKEEYLVRELGTITLEELVKRRILSEEAFSAELESLWRELKDKAKDNGRIRYWDFIGAESYEETVKRAYMTSFLVTYGYATLEIYPLEEEIYIKPFDKPIKTTDKEQLASYPIPISQDEWLRWRKRREEA